MEKIRVFEAFAGVGTQRMALERLGVPYESVGIAEIDKFALQSYEAIHGDLPNYGDISQVKVEELPDMDLFTYSFPCQDISIAGKTSGLTEGSGTRSSLLWECRRVIEGKKPKYLLMENVKNLVGKKFKPDFEKWLVYLESIGYTNYWKVLNAKNYGVPQNRERVFAVSILGEHKPFEFPIEEKLTARLKDILEREVDNKYYLTPEQSKRLEYKRAPMEEEADMINILAHRKNYRRNTQVFDPNGITETIDTGQGGGRNPHTMIKNATKKGWAEAYDGDGVNLAYPNSKTRRGRVQRDMSSTIITGDSNGVLDGCNIRKLTPLECWRLMGITDKDFDKASGAGVSNSQLYKQAGNAIVVDVLIALFTQIFKTE